MTLKTFKTLKLLYGARLRDFVEPLVKFGSFWHPNPAKISSDDPRLLQKFHRVAFHKMYKMKDQPIVLAALVHLQWEISVNLDFCGF